MLDTSNPLAPRRRGALSPAPTLVMVLVSVFAFACAGAPAGAGNGKPASGPAPEGLAKATFAGGCFWCMEGPFDVLDGVVSTTSGYTGGSEERPTYEDVSYGRTGHAESVEVLFDPEKISYERLLEVYWHNVDPTVVDRQFCDHGHQYRTAIFVHDAEQRRLAEASKVEVEKTKSFDGAIVTEIVDAGPFYPAEDYHQDFYKKNPEHYHAYRNGCGRDARLHQLWGDAAGH